ncbi:MAG: hypothetical protein JXR49_19395 [Acidobacteria bacterium]|nr:hypothetical protein [Acidobacteriota bacterium]
MNRSEFFLALYPEGGFIDARAVELGTSRVAQDFIRADDTERIDRFTAKYKDLECYFGVASRVDPSRGGGLQNCGYLGAVFCDIDRKETPDAEKRIQDFIYPPSIIVNSGGGYHAYWVTKEPIDLREESARVKSILRRLAIAIGGDLGSAEPAHVLRIPGTLNHKYNPPRKVEILAGV